MAASVVFEFDGVDSMVAHVTGSTIGHTYFGYTTDPNFSQDTQVAAATSFDLTWSGIGGFTPSDLPFGAHVFDDTTKELVATTVFARGSTSPVPFSASWDYDATSGDVSVTFLAASGVDYELDVFDRADFYSNTVTGAGVSLTLTATATSPFVGEFLGELSSTPPLPYPFYIDQSTRSFQQGVSGAGSMGNPSGAVVVTLDGNDVTQFCVAGQWTRRLNRPSTGTVRCNMEVVSAPVGSLLKIEALVGGVWKIVHHGRVLQAETDTAEDGGYTVYNSTDPMEMWQWRPVRDNDCDFSDPLILQEYTTGPLVLEAALNNSIDCGDSSQADCEGDLFLTVNAAAGGGVDLSGAPVDWPMTIAELASLLISTGEVDVVITPTDPGGGIMGEVDFYNGDYGTDLSATIIFSYGMGDFNVRRLRWNQDMTSMVNKLWYYGGPRISTAADPAAIQHWCWNITGDDPGLAYPPGGELSPPGSATNNQLGVLRASSEAAYGVRMDIQIFDAYDDDCVPGFGTPGRNLFRRRWQQESWLRAVPRELIHITPTRETEIGTFDIGDLVGVEATSAVRGGFSGVQRVYEYTVSWDQDGVLELSELQTSADNEGL